MIMLNARGKLFHAAAAVILAAAAARMRPADAFSTVGIVASSPLRPSVASASALNLQRPVGGRHFQLEELEDAEAASTDVLLNPDRTVTLGGTDGPLYISSSGSWSESCQYMQDDQSEGENFKRLFEMKLTRKFATGSEGTDQSDIGEFEYDVERTYRGECFLVGGSVFAMNGEISDVDEIFGERRVGFFNMIDTTQEGDDADASG
ncbi:hypothetical protein ACHAWF_003251 [Thalassiosira exigua]